MDGFKRCVEVRGDPDDLCIYIYDMDRRLYASYLLVAALHAQQVQMACEEVPTPWGTSKLPNLGCRLGFRVQGSGFSVLALRGRGSPRRAQDIGGAFGTGDSGLVGVERAGGRAGEQGLS